MSLRGTWVRTSARFGEAECIQVEPHAHAASLAGEAIKRRRLQGIRNSLERVTAAHASLKEAITAGRSLFDKPKTRILHGVKVGWQKQKGEIEIADEGASIAMLRKALGKEEAAAYIKTTEKPIRSALQTLSAAILKRCGITVANDTDAVLIKAQDSEIDIAAQQLGLRTPFDDTAYRDMLWSVGRVRSAKDLDAAGRERVLKHLRGCGFQDRPKAGEARYKPGTRPALIRWLWTCLANAGVVRDRSDRALRRYIAQHAGIPHPASVTELAPQHIDGREQDSVIEQLKNWCRAQKVRWE